MKNINSNTRSNMKKEKTNKEMKVGQPCYALFVNVASQFVSFKFVSFKVSKGRYLGKTTDVTRGMSPKYDCVFESDLDSVDYISSDDLFETEDDALKGLIKILNERLKK